MRNSIEQATSVVCRKKSKLKYAVQIVVVTLLFVGLCGADSLNVSLVGRALSGGVCRATYTVADYCYIGGGSRFSVMDISDPTNPTEVGYCYTPGYIPDIFVAGSYAYVADYWDGLRVIDVSDPAHPSGVGFCGTGDHAVGVFVAGSYKLISQMKKMDFE